MCEPQSIWRKLLVLSWLYSCTTHKTLINFENWFSGQTTSLVEISVEDVNDNPPAFTSFPIRKTVNVRNDKKIGSEIAKVVWPQFGTELENSRIDIS